MGRNALQLFELIDMEQHLQRCAACIPGGRSVSHILRIWKFRHVVPFLRTRTNSMQHAAVGAHKHFAEVSH